jgi:hypothetical protein
MNGFNSTGQTKLIGISIALAVVISFPIRNGVLVELDEDLADSKKSLCSSKLVKSSLMPILLILAMAVIAVLFSRSLDSLRLPFNV